MQTYTWLIAVTTVKKKVQAGIYALSMSTETQKEIHTDWHVAGKNLKVSVGCDMHYS